MTDTLEKIIAELPIEDCDRPYWADRLAALRKQGAADWRAILKKSRENCRSQFDGNNGVADWVYEDIEVLFREADGDPAACAQHLCDNRAQCWEPCGDLGKSMEHARPASGPAPAALPAPQTSAEFALRALVAAGHVSQELVDQAMRLPGAPVAPAFDAVERTRLRTYIIRQKPGETPFRKGPFPTNQMVEDFLRKSYALYPSAEHIVIDLDPTSNPQHGYEWLDMYGDKNAPHPRQARAALSAQPAADEPVGVLARLSAQTRAILLNVLWHHQGSSSEVGQAVRQLLGIPQHARLDDEQVSEAKRIESRLALSAQQVPEGWKLAPLEPTLQQLQAACGNRLETARQWYKAMLAAAPQQAGHSVGANKMVPEGWLRTADHGNPSDGLYIAIFRDGQYFPVDLLEYGPYSFYDEDGDHPQANDDGWVFGHGWHTSVEEGGETLVYVCDVVVYLPVDYSTECDGMKAIRKSLEAAPSPVEKQG